MQIKHIVESNSISKLITVNKQLNPRLWQQGELREEVRQKLLEIAQAFEEFIGIDLEVTDYTITGSNANYTWTRHSDLDLHLIVPGTPSEEQRELYSAKKALWGAERDIRIKGLPVECYVQGDAEPHHSSGVYSVKDQQWLVEPKKTQPRVDDAAVRAKYHSLRHDSLVALRSRDLEQLTLVKDKITQMRKAGLARAGEWSTENLVFKLLRNQKIIDRISDQIRDLEDQQLSLEQQTPTLS